MSKLFYLLVFVSIAIVAGSISANADWSPFDNFDMKDRYNMTGAKNVSTEWLTLNNVARNSWPSGGGGSADGNASSICSGTTTYLDGEGNCDQISHLSNFTNDAGYITGYTETDPDWTGNESLIYKKTAIDTQGEMETIWSITLSTDSERTTGLAAQDACSEITNCVPNAWDANADISVDEISESKIAFSTACASGNHYYLNGNDLACEADDDTTYTNGSGIGLIGTQFNHSDTSSISNVNNAGTTVVQDITFDEFGHTQTIVSIDLGAHTTDTGPSPDCTGTTTYQDGNGGCDDISGVYVQAADWTTIDDYPASCGASTPFVNTIGDTNICNGFVADTSPQLGGELQTNGNNINVTSGDKICLSNDAGCTSYIWFNGTNVQIVG